MGRNKQPLQQRTGTVAANSQKNRSALLSFFDRTGTPAIIIFALTIGIGVWSWLAYVVHSPQDINTFGFIFLGVNVVGAAAQMIYMVFFRKYGSVQDHVTPETRQDARAGSSVIFWGPTVIFGLVFLLVTPPGTSAAAVEYGWNIYQAIGLFTMLSFLAAAIGSLLLYALVIIPGALIISGLLPGKASKVSVREKTPTNLLPASMSRTESLSAGLIIIIIVVFAVDMQFIAPSRITTNFSREAMLEQFLYFVTLHGSLVATIIAVLCIVAIVVLAIISNRAANRRMRAWRASVGAPAKKTT